jgi:uncharacterized membrane protein
LLRNLLFSIGGSAVFLLAQTLINIFFTQLHQEEKPIIQDISILLLKKGDILYICPLFLIV